MPVQARRLQLTGPKSRRFEPLNKFGKNHRYDFLNYSKKHDFLNYSHFDKKFCVWTSFLNKNKISLSAEKILKLKIR